MAELIVTSYFGHLTASADAGPFAFDGGSEQVWIDIFVSAVQGVATLPIALVIVWFFYRAKLDRWTLLNAVLATVFAIAIVALLETVELHLWTAVAAGLSAIGFHRFFYELWPAIGVLLVGSQLFAFWLKRGRKSKLTFLSDDFE